MFRSWSFGNNRIQIKADLQAIDNLLQAVQADSPNYDVATSSFEDNRAAPVLPGELRVKTTSRSAT